MRAAEGRQVCGGQGVFKPERRGGGGGGREEEETGGRQWGNVERNRGQGESRGTGVHGAGGGGAGRGGGALGVRGSQGECGGMAGERGAGLPGAKEEVGARAQQRSLPRTQTGQTKTGDKGVAARRGGERVSR